MDIASHGLWGGISVGRKNRKSFWTAFAFGILPDLLPFAPFFIIRALSAEGMIVGPPDIGIIPPYVYSAYSVTHSLIVFGLIFGVVWLARGKPLKEMLAWGLHVLMDIPFHSKAFFPTPFLWPISDYSFDGIPWARPVIFIPNILLLLVLYVRYYRATNRNRPA